MVMWKGQAARLAFRPEDGIEVIATGKLTTYPGRSKYQLVVESLEVAGEGALMLLFEKLKARLGAEGLFDREGKQPLPVSYTHLSTISTADARNAVSTSSAVPIGDYLACCLRSGQKPNGFLRRQERSGLRPERPKQR